jgi:hypothetical protein
MKTNWHLESAPNYLEFETFGYYLESFNLLLFNISNNLDKYNTKLISY